MLKTKQKFTIYIYYYYYYGYIINIYLLIIIKDFKKVKTNKIAFLLKQNFYYVCFYPFLDFTLLCVLEKPKIQTKTLFSKNL